MVFSLLFVASFQDKFMDLMTASFDGQDIFMLV